MSSSATSASGSELLYCYERGRGSKARTGLKKLEQSFYWTKRGRKMRFLTVFLVVFDLLFCHAEAFGSVEIQRKVSEELESLFSSRWEKDQKYWPRSTFPPLLWDQQKGIYPSFVHINFHGKQTQSSLRSMLKFPDSNGFVTMFIVQALMESAEMDASLQITDDQLLDSVHAIMSHQDKNLDNGTGTSSTPVYNFWNQYLNSKGNHYQASPPNLAIPLSLGLSFSDILSKIASSLHIPVDTSSIAGPISSFLQAFQIPPDSDDTGVGLALGMKLSSLRNKFPRSFRVWEPRNSDIKALVKVWKHYKYDPFDKRSQSRRTIDPRTYFWIRKFLHQVQRDEGEDASLSIIPTWLLDLDDIRDKFYTQEISMPFQTNNLDASVIANAIFGLSSAYIYSSETGHSIFESDQELQKLYLDSARLLKFALDENIMGYRADLALLYYPPVYDFYWFVSRIVHLLNSYSHSINVSVIKEVQHLLTEGIRGPGTEQLISRRVEDPSGYVYWDDFLGNSDEKFEDRVFSTSVALNALIDAWTVQSDTVNGRKAVKWVSECPASIKSIISRGAKWLVEESKKFPYENAFFSGSVKSPTHALPFFYPHNLFEKVNGTKLSCSSKLSQSGDSDDIIGVEGVISEATYLDMLAGDCLGVHVPMDYPGNNCPSCTFPYWSSPPLTSALQVLALSKVKVLLETSIS